MTTTFEDRYGPNWHETARRARQLCGNRCILCGAPADEVHHAAYRDHRGMIAGREIPGVHVFPLCLNCHKGESGAHATNHWHGDRENPVEGNHQNPTFYRKLRAAWVAAVHQS